MGGLFNIAEATVEEYKIDQASPGSVANTPAPLTQDGIYYAMVIDYSGDTRGIEWYSTIVGVQYAPATNPLNSVSTSYAF